MVEVRHSVVIAVLVAPLGVLVRVVVLVQAVLVALVQLGIVGVGVGLVRGAERGLPVLDALLIGLPLSSPLEGLDRVIGLVLVLLVVDHFVLDVVDGCRGVSRRARLACARNPRY